MRKWIVRSIVPVLVLVVGTGAVEIIVRSQEDSNFAQERRALLVLERTIILNTSDKTNVEKDRLCKLYNSGLFKHENNAELLYEVIGKDLRCTKRGYNTTMNVPAIADGDKNLMKKSKRLHQ